MRCKVCTNQLTKRNRSPVKGICKADFRVTSARSLYRLTEPSMFGRPVRDTAPSPTLELYARHMEALKEGPIYEFEADLTDEQVSQLLELRRKKLERITIPFPYPEASLVPPTQTKLEILQVDLSEEEQVLLQRIRDLRKWEGR